MQKGNKKREREKDPDAIQRTGHLLFYSLESTDPDYYTAKEGRDSHSQSSYVVNLRTYH